MRLIDDGVEVLELLAGVGALPAEVLPLCVGATTEPLPPPHNLAVQVSYDAFQLLEEVLLQTHLLVAGVTLIAGGGGGKGKQ